MESEEQKKKLRDQVKKLKKIESPAQKSHEWYLQRQTKVTASEVGNCLFATRKICEEYVNLFGLQDSFKYSETRCLNPYTNRKAYIRKKALEFGKEIKLVDNEFTLWGKKYEEVATRFYCLTKGTDISDFGLIPHPRIKWLAASPDGITDDGVMLEIKCPKRRQITGIPPIYYYCQMQLQLECCNLEECDFLECEIVEVPLEEWRANITYPTIQKGLLIECGNEVFKYLPRTSIETAEEMEAWAEMNCDFGERICYYFIIHYNLMTIKRSREWFAAVKEDIRETWQDFMNEIEELKHLENEPKDPAECLL
jgi:putative phage-type endonuclease